MLTVTETAQRWMKFLAIDDATVRTLEEFSELVSPHIDRLLDRFYMRLLTNPEVARLVPRGENYTRVRGRQRQHWVEHVFCGNFDLNYSRETAKMGLAHYRIGLDAAILSASYEFVLEDIAQLLSEHFPDGDPATLRLLRAVRKAVFLDLGLANQHYYETHTSELESMAERLLLSLARAAEYRDDNTGLHVRRVGLMCRAVAVALGQPESWCDHFEVASRLHDLGKIGIPNSILLKPGALDAAEVEVMRTHPGIAEDIIPDHPHEIITMARRAAATHHERWDGEGYPLGLKGDEIPIEGRIVAICDVYDALQTERSYKHPWSPSDAADFIAENSGKMFDPTVVDSFLLILPALDELRADTSAGDGQEAIASPPVGSLI